jgi:hypothetical protein
MKFFTPELYLQFNSPEAGSTDSGIEGWGKVSQDYDNHLKRNYKHLNERVRDAAANLSLRDSELLSIQENAPGRASSPPFFPISIATISVRSGSVITNLVYFLWSEIRQSRPEDDWPVSDSRPIWLQDEYDVEPHPSYLPMYWHRILWNNGKVFSIPFFDLIVHQFDLD